jgi:putative transposase
MAQQARNLRLHFDDLPLKPTHFIHDRDGKFTPQFDNLLQSDGGPGIVKLPPRSPNMNAYAERWVRYFRTECLDHFIIFGEAHMRHITEEFVAHYNEERPHQGKENNLLTSSEFAPSTMGHLTCKTRLGGLLKHYFRQAAWPKFRIHFSKIDRLKLYDHFIISANRLVGEALKVSAQNWLLTQLRCKSPFCGRNSF